MATALISVVDLIHPAASGINVFLSDTVWVLFDREIDETTVAGGNFFLTGPDFDTWSGPDLQIYNDYESIGSEAEILQSPGYHGIVQGTISFQRVSNSDPDVIVSGIDTVGSGLYYRSKIILTPSERLAPNTEYTVYLTGDEDLDDSLATGISSRTVFDAVADGGNTSAGSVTFAGGYTGDIADVYHIEITTAGDVGTARFKYWTDSVPALSIAIKTKSAGVLLSNGVCVEFSDGTFVLGDTWTCVVKPRDTFEGNLYWTFRTGTGSISDIPDEVSTSILGDAITVVPETGATSTFSVTSTDPVDESTHQTIPAGPFDIQVVLSDNIDSATVISGVTVQVVTEPVNGDIDIAAQGACAINPTVSGQTLTITVASGHLYDNNLVTVTLDSSIASTGGTTLGEDYEFWFTTTYDPYYCTLRKIRLDIGAYIQNVPDDTVNLAIFEASLQADAQTWNTLNLTDAYYQFVRTQWSCCKAQEILLINTVSLQNNLRAKQLGDLRVEYQGGQKSNALDRALACLEKLESALHAGGRAIQTATMVIKGEDDPDRPPTGRGWYSSNYSGMPAANTRYTDTGTRRYRNTYYRTYKGKTRYDT